MTGSSPTPGSEKRIVTRPDDSFGLDFRDPNVRINQAAYEDPSSAAASWDGSGRTAYATMAIATSMPVRKVSEEARAASDATPTPGLSTIDTGGWYAEAPSTPRGSANPEPERCPALAVFSNPTPDLAGDRWEFDTILLADTANPAAAFECPDHFTLGGSDVAVGALMNHRDGQGVYRPVRWYSGERIGGRLQVRQTGLCDEGPCYYAVQSFTDDTGRRIAFGWLQDYFGVRRERPGASNGDMSLPRELSVRSGHLFSHPVSEVYGQLVGKRLGGFEAGGFAGRGGMRVFDPVAVPGNSYYADIRFDAGANDDETAHDDFRRTENFRLLLGRYQDRSILLECSQTRVRLLLEGVEVFGADFDARVEDLSRVEVFYDHGIAECFVNDGEQAITVLLDDPRVDGGCGPLSVMYPNVVMKADIHELRL